IATVQAQRETIAGTTRRRGLRLAVDEVVHRDGVCAGGIVAGAEGGIAAGDAHAGDPLRPVVGDPEERKVLTAGWQSGNREGSQRESRQVEELDRRRGRRVDVGEYGAKAADEGLCRRAGHEESRLRDVAADGC